MNNRRIHNETWQSFFWGVPALVWQTLFFYVPLVTILYIAVRPSSWRFISLCFSVPHLAIFAKTSVLAVTTTVVCLGVGYPLAYWLTYHVKAYKNLFLFFVLLPFWTNFLLHVYAWMFLLDRNGLFNRIVMAIFGLHEPVAVLNTVWAVLVGMVYCYLPFMVLPLYSTLSSLPGEYIEAAYDLGATTRQIFARVIWPLSLSGVRSGVFLVFVPAFGEFALPELLGGDRHLYVGSVISHLTLSSSSPAFGAVFTLLTGCFVLLISAFVYYSVAEREHL